MAAAAAENTTAAAAAAGTAALAAAAAAAAAEIAPQGARARADGTAEMAREVMIETTALAAAAGVAEAVAADDYRAVTEEVVAGPTMMIGGGAEAAAAPAPAGGGMDTTAAAATEAEEERAKEVLAGGSGPAARAPAGLLPLTGRLRGGGTIMLGPLMLRGQGIEVGAGVRSVGGLAQRSGGRTPSRLCEHCVLGSRSSIQICPMVPIVDFCVT